MTGNNHAEHLHFQEFGVSDIEGGGLIGFGGSIASLTDKMELIGPEVTDSKALAVPLNQAEILVTNKEVVDKTFESLRHIPIDQTAFGR